MNRLVFLVEDRSMAEFVREYVPRVVPGVAFDCIEHEGKADLEKSIPRKLREWGDPLARFIILRDNDGANCRTTKARLVRICGTVGQPRVFVRIACQELEAWYLGDPEALAAVCSEPRLATLGRRARYRDPDAVAQPSAAIRSLVGDFRKVAAAREMGRLIDPERCTSRSFSVFTAAVRSAASRGE